MSIEEMMTTGQVRFYILCEDCSKKKECGERLSPGCCNWAGYRNKLKESNYER